jgi:rubrerythrin
MNLSNSNTAKNLEDAFAGESMANRKYLAPVTKGLTNNPATQKWICRQCSVIYDPVVGDLDAGIATGTSFEAIPSDWQCPICGAKKELFVPYQEAIAT